MKASVSQVLRPRALCRRAFPLAWSWVEFHLEEEPVEVKVLRILWE